MDIWLLVVMDIWLLVHMAFGPHECYSLRMVLAYLNLKGGTGKTTLAVHVACE